VEKTTPRNQKSAEADPVNSVRQNHSITIDNRGKAHATGISEVTSYDAQSIIAVSSSGDLIVQGRQLHISSFDQNSGKLSIDGTIDTLQYTDRKNKNESFFSKLLK